MQKFAALLMSMAVALAAVPGAIAQDAAKPPAQPPVSSTPERTTASFGDWVLRCEGAAPGAKRTCEVALVLSAQGQTAPIAQVAIGRELADHRPVTIVLPHNVMLTTKPQVALAKNAKDSFELTWQKCTPGACFAAASVPPSIVAAMTAQTEAGKIVYKTAAEQEVALPFSTRGLAQALAAMAKEP